MDNKLPRFNVLTKQCSQLETGQQTTISEDVGELTVNEKRSSGHER